MATSFLRRKPARVGKNGVAASNHANTADRKKRAPADWLRYAGKEIESIYLLYR